MSIPEVDTSVEVEELDVYKMKKEMLKLKQRMAEMYQAWSKGQSPPAYPANPTLTPPLAQSQDPPATDLGFPIYQHYHGTTSHTSQAPPPKSVPYPPPPITPIFVTSPPTALHKSPSEPLFQAQDNQYYPPELTFKAPGAYPHDPHSDLPEKAEKPARNPEQEEMFRKMKSIEQSFRDMRGLGGQLGMLSTVEPKMPNPPPRNLDHSVSCEYCSGAPGHDTEKCWKLKTAMQELIDTHRIKVQAPETPNINQNPLPAHHETHMIELIHKEGEPRKPSQTVMRIRSSETSSKEKVPSGKSVVQLRGVDDKPTVVAERGSSRIVAVKPEKAKVVVPGVASKHVVVVKGARTEPVIIKSVIQLPVINNKVVSWNYEQATMIYKGKEVKGEVCEAQDDELSVEGTEHNKALYLTVKCEDSVVTRVLIDNGFSANIYPLTTLKKLKVDGDRIHKNNIYVRGFDNGGTDTVGDIVLELTIGLVEFTMEFQVLDVAMSYNLLLGRPWIHSAKAVPSTLHQMVKFE
ncbi:uncharacterized protein [Nicotiana sylvestris]|uniref:uncharacterized protein n=1 Tax=Nicotiana sylvestris TaxID=4096 RepID=UPI00388C8B8C